MVRKTCDPRDGLITCNGGGRGVYDGIGRVDVGEVRPLVRREEGRDTSSRRRIDTSRVAVEGRDTIGAVAERYAWAMEAAGE